DHYRRAQEADPSNVEAAQRLKDIGTPTEAPPPPPPAAEAPPEYQELVLDLEDSASVHAPQPKVASIETDEAPAAPPPHAVARGREPAAARPAPAPPAPPSPPPAAAVAPPALEDAQQIETLIVEAEVFAKYGLSDKAIERLFSLVRRRPDLLKARERL